MGKHRKKETSETSETSEQNTPVQTAPVTATPASVTPVQAALQRKTLTPYEIGVSDTVTVEEFLEEDAAVVAEFLAEQSKAEAQIKPIRLAPLFDFGRSARRERRNFALNKIIEWAKNAALKRREELQRGASKAFTEGRPEKIQAVLANPAQFKKSKETDFSFTADMLIPLMSASALPAAVPDIALAKVPAGKLKNILNYTLYRLVSEYNVKEIEKLAPVLMHIGAKASSLGLAEAVHKNISPALVVQMLGNGASYDETLKLMNSNKGRFGYSIERLASIREKLALQSENQSLKAQLDALRDNKSDITVSKMTDLRQPAAVPAGRHRKPQNNL